jgi:hypothetical protein
MSKHICGKRGERSVVPCVVCEVIEDDREAALYKGWCASVRDGMICDRVAGHTGAHRGYRPQQDVPVFWRQR